MLAALPASREEAAASLGATHVQVIARVLLPPLRPALLAAYAFAWIDFPFRNALFVAVFALQIVPLQIALLPLVTMFQDLGLGGSYWSLWLSHSAFALPLAVVQVAH